MNNFNTNNYMIIKKAISTEMTQFIYEYICLRRKIATHMFEKKFRWRPLANLFKT